MQYNQQDLYNESYKKFTPDWFQVENTKAIDEYLKENNESLISFYETFLAQFPSHIPAASELKVLDLGCGLGGLSFYFAKKGAKVTGIDISSLAIAGAKQLAKNKNIRVDFRVLDLGQEQKWDEKFDLIFDSHLLHCLTNKEQRSHYYNFIANALTKEGHFLCETMAQSSHLRIPVGYHLDENFVLSKEMGDDQLSPIRKIVDVKDIEDEIALSNLKIHTLYYHSELAFALFDEYPVQDHQYLPKTLRFSCQKA